MPSDVTVLPVDSPAAQKLDALHALMREIRGTSIDQAIWIDVFVTDMLASFFCADKERRALLSSDVLAGRDASFSGRLEVLESIARKWFPEFLSSHGRLFEQLDKIRRFRNRLAHSRLDTTEAILAKGYTDRIQLIFNENGAEKTQVVTVTEFEERLKEGTEVTYSLLELQQLISPNHAFKADVPEGTRP